MSIGNGQIITAADVQALKNVIATECSSARRGREQGTGSWQSNGSLSDYYSGANNSSHNKSSVIQASQINTLMKPVFKARTNNEQTVSVGQVISLSNLNSDASLLASKEITSSDHGCASACMGLCSSGCYSNCSSCTGCSGCSDTCQGTCTNTCTGGCQESCSSSCTGSCSTSCTGGCQGCSGSCSGGCIGGCQGAGCHTGAWTTTTCYSW